MDSVKQLGRSAKMSVAVQGLIDTALALCRFHFEAVVRATWTAQCAYDEWSDKFTKPVEGPGQKEPANPVSIDLMIKHIASAVPHIGAQYALLSRSVIPAMQSFVHIGTQAVVHALLPTYPVHKLIAVMWNRLKCCSRRR